MSKNISEIARLRAQIALEYQAAHNALSAPAMVGRHAFITKRMERMQQAHAALESLVGAGEALKLMAQTLEPLGREEEPKGGTSLMRERQFYIDQSAQPIPVLSVRRQTREERLVRVKQTAEAIDRQFLAGHGEHDMASLLCVPENK